MYFDSVEMDGDGGTVELDSCPAESWKILRLTHLSSRDSRLGIPAHTCSALWPRQGRQGRPGTTQPRGQRGVGDCMHCAPAGSFRCSPTHSPRTFLSYELRGLGGLVVRPGLVAGVVSRDRDSVMTEEPLGRDECSFFSFGSSSNYQVLHVW
jgi:hypothetical protein